ncbi:esterase OVCA2 [Tyto alba]|uniref:esterase OVCA2 n=1 Tax=Tyto alba TaxID=56313 RepID=UPI001C667CE4|nr:esterase OVCA2 [Tyto alba]
MHRGSRPPSRRSSPRRDLPPAGGALARQSVVSPRRPMNAMCFGGKGADGGGESRKWRSPLPVGVVAMSEGRPLRLLGLHGYRQSERRFRQRTGALRKALRGRAELVAVNAPHAVPGGEDDDRDDPPRGWWFSGPGTFEAGEAAAAPAGLEESLSAVATALVEHGPFDGLLGFSQGAALAAMVCALRARGDPRFPVAFAVLVAGFASRAPAHGHFYREPIALPTLHVVGDADAVIAAPLSRELARRFVEPVVLTHPGGHFVPAAAPQKKAYLDFLDRFHPRQG